MNSKTLRHTERHRCVCEASAYPLEPDLQHTHTHTEGSRGGIVRNEGVLQTEDEGFKPLPWWPSVLLKCPRAGRHSANFVAIFRKPKIYICHVQKN